MSKIWGLNGVWLSFPAAEAITFLVVLAMGGLFDKEGRREYSKSGKYQNG